MTPSSPLLVTRAEPGNGVTVKRARAMGLHARAMPLFAARPLAWQAPDPDDFDALLLTSAQAARLAGDGLARLATLPVLAVGAATAAAAKAAGLTVAATGTRDAQYLLDAMTSRTYARILWLCGRDRSDFTADGAALTALPCYGVDPIDPPPDWDALIAEPAILLAHSARGAGRIASLAGAARAHLSLVAISAKAADAAGDGWARIAVASSPDDAAMVTAAHALCQKTG